MADAAGKTKQAPRVTMLYRVLCSMGDVLYRVLCSMGDVPTVGWLSWQSVRQKTTNRLSAAKDFPPKPAFSANSLMVSAQPLRTFACTVRKTIPNSGTGGS